MALIIAVIADCLFGEPYLVFHIVHYIGAVVDFLDKRLKHTIMNGMLTYVLTCSIFLFGTFLLLHTGSLLTTVFHVFLLKSCFAISSLYVHVGRCRQDDTVGLRKAVSMIVSRDTANLSKGELYSAAVETLAENYVDSVLSPIFFYLIFGIYGVVIYRVTNTMDAMIGYRNEKYEKFGKFAARADDVLNYIPARLSVLFFLVFSPVAVSKSVFKFGGIKINGTKPMASMSGLLKINLKKNGVYDLNPQYRQPEKKDLDRAMLYYILIVAMTCIIGVVCIWMIQNFSWLNMEETFLFRGLIFQYL
jgi:adenosylcobinamide-phosphate synthase